MQVEVGFFLKGLVLGIAIAAPVGPIGVLCIRRTLAEGRAAGLASGLGAATADAVYGSVAGFGLTAISGALVGGRFWLGLGGGLFLLYLGVRTFFSQPAERAAAAAGRGLLGAYGSTFLLTITNPVTILSFAGVMAGLKVGVSGGNYLSAAALVAGVFTGSALWWLLLSGAVSLLRSRFDSRAMRWVNRISGLVIAGFGAAALLSLLGLM